MSRLLLKDDALHDQEAAALQLMENPGDRRPARPVLGETSKFLCTSPILRIYSKSQTYLSIISNSVSHNLISAKQKKKAENYPLYIRQRLLIPIYQKCLANASPQPLYLRPKRGGSQFQLLRKSNSTPQRAKSISPVFTNANSSG